MGYGSISLPNYFGQTSQEEAGYLVNLLSTLQSTSDCRKLMTSVACGLTFPKCAEDNKPFPICRADCKGSYGWFSCMIDMWMLFIIG